MDTYLGIPGNHSGKTFDKLLELVPSGTSMTDATGSSPVYIGEGLVDADLVIDLNTVTIASSGTSSITVQFCDVEGFPANVVAGPVINLTSGQTGRMIVPFRNDPVGTPLPYVRLMPVVSTALVAGAFIAKK